MHTPHCLKCSLETNMRICYGRILPLRSHERIQQPTASRPMTVCNALKMQLNQDTSAC